MRTTRRRFLGAVACALGASACAAPLRPKSILLYSAWSTYNIGDIGQTPGTLRVIERHLPDVDVTLWARSLNEPVETMIRRRFPRLRIVRGDLDLSTAGPTTPQLRQAFQQADLFIHNSSMSMGLDPLRWCLRVGKPFGWYGQSWPEWFGKDAKRRDVLDAARFIFCRDSLTLGALRTAGVKASTLEFGPDGCFGMDVHDDVRALAFLRRCGLEDRKFMTIQLRTNTAKTRWHTSGSAANPVNPTPQQKAEDERRAAVYREVMTAWVKKPGFKVLIAPEMEKEIEHNKRLLYDPLPGEVKRHVVRRETFWNADEAASVFARAHTVLCHEPHAPIIALANGTPMIHTFTSLHGSKAWMFKDIGLPEWLLELDTTPAARLIETLLAIDADYPAALRKVSKAMRFVEQRQSETMTVVRKVLGE